MFALNWDWEEPGTASNMSQRLGNSLCSGIGGTAAAGESLGISWAHRPSGRATRARPSWRPALLPGDRLCIFNGFLDNAEELNRILGAASTDPALLYAAAVERWGDEADLPLVGDYCAALAHVPNRTLRLARSPIVSQPLTYAVHDDGVAVASVPRAIFAAGVPRTLNEARVVDAAMVNYSDHEASWFEGLARVPMGSLVELAPGRPRRLVRYYDPDSIRTIDISDEEAIERTRALMAEGVRACLKGFSSPGANLSAGLDSSQVAVHALDALPPDQELPTFTFTPEDGWDGRTEPAKLGNERPKVEAFAALARHFGATGCPFFSRRRPVTATLFPSGACTGRGAVPLGVTTRVLRRMNSLNSRGLGPEGAEQVCGHGTAVVAGRAQIIDRVNLGGKPASRIFDGAAAAGNRCQQGFSARESNHGRPNAAERDRRRRRAHARHHHFRNRLRRAGPDFAEPLFSLDGGNLNRGHQLVGVPHGRAIAGVEAVERHAPLATQALQHNHRVGRGENGKGIARGRRVGDVSAERSTILDLHAADFLRGRHQHRQLLPHES